MFAKVSSMGLFGMDVFSVEVETDLSQGLPKFDIVGLPDAAVSEAKDRVRSAIKNNGFTFPVSRITPLPTLKKRGRFMTLQYSLRF